MASAELPGSMTPVDGAYCCSLFDCDGLPLGVAMVFATNAHQAADLCFLSGRGITQPDTIFFISVSRAFEPQALIVRDDLVRKLRMCSKALRSLL